MTLESTKISLAQWILSINDKDLIDKIASYVVTVRQSEKEDSSLKYVTYKSIFNEKFDLNEIKKEQNYRPFEDGELDSLIREADIQEPIDVLLDSID